MKIALVQMQVLERNRAANAQHGLELIRQAAPGHDVVLLPEIWTTGYSLSHLKWDAETLDNEFIRSLQELAKKYNCNLLPGSLPVRHDGKVYNTSLVIDREGRIVYIYDKVHLFGMCHESVFFGAGNNFEGYKLDGWQAASTICYDLRFPELHRHMALAGAEIGFVAAEWPEVRGQVWRLLLQARAAENRMFMVGVNAVGENRGQKFFGHSMVCGPEGRIIAEAGGTEEIVSVEIQMDEVAKARSVMNVLADVRRELMR